MREAKIGAIQTWLQAGFAGCTVAHKHDFDRIAETFKISSETNTWLLKVGDDFIDDNTAEEILRLFAMFGLRAALAKETEIGVLVTQDGLQTFVRGS